MDGERRAPRRLPCNVAVTVHSGGIRAGCTVRDISEFGCQLVGDVFPLGNEVEVHFPKPSLAVPGRVAWKTFENAGIEFRATIAVTRRG